MLLLAVVVVAEAVAVAALLVLLVLAAFFHFLRICCSLTMSLILFDFLDDESISLYLNVEIYMWKK